MSKPTTKICPDCKDRMPKRETCATCQTSGRIWLIKVDVPEIPTVSPSQKIRKAARDRTQLLMRELVKENKSLRKEISRLQVIIARYQIRLGKAGIHFKQLHKLLREHKPN